MDLDKIKFPFEVEEVSENEFFYMARLGSPIGQYVWFDVENDTYRLLINCGGEGGGNEIISFPTLEDVYKFSIGKMTILTPCISDYLNNKVTYSTYAPQIQDESSDIEWEIT